MSAEEKNDEGLTAGTEPRRSRKDLLKTAGLVAGAAVAGKLASADSASAADGADLQVGFDNSETQGKTTSLTTSVGTPYTAPSEDPAAAALKVTAPNFPYGIHGDSRDYGVVGGGTLAGAGVLGLGAVGGVFSGSVVAINLDPQDPPNLGGPVNAPTGQAFKGDLAVNSAGILWFCIADSPLGGGPGTWIKLSHGGSRFLDTPQRAYDTRDAGKGRLTANNGSTGSPRQIPIGGLFGIPATAVGIFGTLSIVVPDALIFASLWPSGAFPGTANILANAGAFISTSFSVGLNPTNGTILIGSSGPTDAIIDVAGYIL